MQRYEYVFIYSQQIKISSISIVDSTVLALKSQLASHSTLWGGYD